jgi:hypothetical protein
MDDDDLIYAVLSRPRMHLPHLKTVRDVLIFVAGVNCGRHPPHGGSMLIAFERFLNERLAADGSPQQKPFTLGPHAQKPLSELGERIAELYEEWIASQAHKELVNVDWSVYEGRE